MLYWQQMTPNQNTSLLLCSVVMDNNTAQCITILISTVTTALSYNTFVLKLKPIELNLQAYISLQPKMTNQKSNLF